MTTRNPLSPEDWRFLELVAEAAFSNPFGSDREALDARIAGVPPGTSPEGAVEAAIGKVEVCVDRLRRAGQADLRRHAGERAETVRATLLFLLFHRFAEPFDALIDAQSRAGDAPVPVPFAAEAMSAFAEHGFTGEESARHLALFHQMRRAFRFVRDGLTGGSAPMRTLRMRLWNSVFTRDIRWFESRLRDRMTEFPVLLLGETGTGKGEAAAAIGRSGFIPFDAAKGRFAASFTRNFVAANLSQYAEGLLESELFGHRKGAFTGATDHHEGLFARCAPNGVVFLDEIGDASGPVQVKLLRVLQERVFYPVGGREACRFDGRVVAATNRPLATLRREGRFRDDLYFRLCSDEIALPTLRDRLREAPGELHLLVSGILKRLDPASTPGEAAAIAATLERSPGRGYAWPGNVRELEQAVKRVLLSGAYGGAGSPASPRPDGFSEAVLEGRADAATLLSEYCAMLHRRTGNYGEVARITGLDRRTVRKRILSLDSDGRL
jgi:DNA-binding NtrC family response regulator